MGESSRPGLIRGVSFFAAGSYKAEGGLALLDVMIGSGRKPDAILVDRGYTYLDSNQWARQVWAREIEQVLDLHESQRGARPGPIPGTLYVDGGLFKDTLPKDLRALGGFTLGMSADAKALLAQEYDKRKHHAFTPMGRPNCERGTRRYRDRFSRAPCGAPTTPPRCDWMPRATRRPPAWKDNPAAAGPR